MNPGTENRSTWHSAEEPEISASVGYLAYVVIFAFITQAVSFAKYVTSTAQNEAVKI